MKGERKTGKLGIGVILLTGMEFTAGQDALQVAPCPFLSRGMVTGSSVSQRITAWRFLFLPFMLLSLKIGSIALSVENAMITRILPVKLKAEFRENILASCFFPVLRQLCVRQQENLSVIGWIRMS